MAHLLWPHGSSGGRTRINFLVDYTATAASRYSCDTYRRAINARVVWGRQTGTAIANTVMPPRPADQALILVEVLMIAEALVCPTAAFATSPFRDTK